MAYYRRSSWTSASNGAVAIKQTQRHVSLHYPGFGSNSIKTAGWSRQQCFNQIAAWRRMHVPRTYREIAYNFFALPTGDFVEGRGFRQNGANGTSAANRAGLSIQVLIGDNESLTPGHIKAVNDCLAHIRKSYPTATGTLYGHQHWVSTRCPGPYVMAAIRGGKFGAGKGSTPAPSKPAPSTPGLSDGLADVDKAQRWLADLGYSPGPVDGKFGTRTQAATRQFQTDFGITPADGRPGPATRTEMEATVAKIDRLEAIATESQKRIDRSIAIGTENQNRINALRDELDWVRRVVEVNQKRIGYVDAKVSHINRDGTPVSLRQEVADAKTFAMANAAQIKNISTLLAEANVDATEAKVSDEPEG